jgi:dynactin complex subunit
MEDSSLIIKELEEENRRLKQQIIDYSKNKHELETIIESDKMIIRVYEKDIKRYLHEIDMYRSMLESENSDL